MTTFSIFLVATILFTLIVGMIFFIVSPYDRKQYLKDIKNIYSSNTKKTPVKKVPAKKKKKKKPVKKVSVKSQTTNINNVYRKPPEGHKHDDSYHPSVKSELARWIADIEQLQREKGFLGYPAPPDHLCEEWERIKGNVKNRNESKVTSVKEVFTVPVL
jgi:hypothetical protein